MLYIRIYNVEKRLATASDSAGFDARDYISLFQNMQLAFDYHNRSYICSTVVSPLCRDPPDHLHENRIYTRGYATKWQHWDMSIHCTDQNATSADFLDVQVAVGRRMRIA